MEEKQYCEVFFKDDRNRRGGYNAKKRTNAKEVARRNHIINKRQTQKGNELHQEPFSEEEVEETKSKYDNGKPKKVLKEQEYYQEEEDAPEKKAKKGKKGK